jgi:predicted RNA-binding Zn ribbon-like protein
MSEDVSKRAPGDLDLIRRFVNTLDVEDGTDDFPDAASLGRWLREERLPARGLTAADLGTARHLREALRDVLSTHNGADPSPEAIARLNAIGAGVTLRVAFAPGGAARLEPSGDGFAPAAGRLLAIVERAQAEGTWERLKICPAGDCRWAFYDRSRNRSAVWCNMAICGNRAKVRGYRERAAHSRA